MKTMSVEGTVLNMHGVILRSTSLKFSPACPNSIKQSRLAGRCNFCCKKKWHFRYAIDLRTPWVGLWLPEVYSTWTIVERMFPAVYGGLLYMDYNRVHVYCSVWAGGLLMDYSRVYVYMEVYSTWTIVECTCMFPAVNGGLLHMGYSGVYVYCSEWRFTPHGL